MSRFVDFPEYVMAHGSTHESWVLAHPEDLLLTEEGLREAEEASARAYMGRFCPQITWLALEARWVTP